MIVPAIIGPPTPPETIVFVDASGLTLHSVGRHVLIVGDSEACAVGSFAQGVADAVDDELDLPHDTVRVVCKKSTTVQYWGAAGKFRDALLGYSTDAVLIFLGTNHYRSAAVLPIKPITDLVSEHGLGCVWVGNVAVNGKHWPINDVLKVEVVPTCTYFDTEAAAIPLWDGVHPRKTGAEKWLRLIWPLIPVKYLEK